MKTFNFVKENDGRWFINYPEWKGHRDELEMVAGADILLDYCSNYSNECSFNVSEEIIENSIELTKDREVGGGAVYSVKNCPAILELWFCHVTKFVYDGRLPEKLYFMLIN